jgi:hypothetical protein
MKKWLLIIIPIVLIAILVVWFWSLASVPEAKARSVTLTVQETGVEVRPPGAAAWEAAVSGMEIGEGWSVRTDKTGLATISFYGQGQSRLASGTEVTITQSMTDALNPSSAQVELELDAGRVWSRVLKLFDLASSYSVRTSSVVATVRGTAFDVRANADGSSGVIVNESAVDVGSPNSTASASPEAIAEGFAVSFASNGSMEDVREIAPEEKNSAWFRRNAASDEAFVAAERERRLEALRALDGPRPDSLLSGAASLSERLHLAFTDGTDRELLAQRYLARRYLRVLDLVEQGKAGLAAQEFARLENYIRTELRGPDAEAERRRILLALRRVTFLVEDADPDSPLYAFKQRMENLAEALTESNEGSMLYVRLLALDARLDEAARMMRRSAFEEAQMVLDGVAKGIANVSREAEPVLPRLTEDQQRTIRGKISALRAREAAMRSRLEAALAPPEEEETATSTEDGTSEPPADAPPERTPPESVSPDEPVTVAPEFDRIALFIQPNPLPVGQTASLVVTGYRADGSQENVSTLSTFSVQQNSGSLNGPRFTATKAGNTTVTASYDDNGVTRSASAPVTTESDAVLESLTLTSTAGTTLKATQGTNITAQARYSDGYVKDVTTLTEYSLSGVGSLNITSYTTNRGTTGTATITGYFTENGVTVQGSVVLNVL